MVALFGWGEAALGGSGGIFEMNICFSTSQRLKKICKEWQRRFSIKTLAHLHGLLYIDSYIYGCNWGALIKNPKVGGEGKKNKSSFWVSIKGAFHIREIKVVKGYKRKTSLKLLCGFLFFFLTKPLFWLFLSLPPLPRPLHFSQVCQHAGCGTVTVILISGLGAIIWLLQRAAHQGNFMAWREKLCKRAAWAPFITTHPPDSALAHGHSPTALPQLRPRPPGDAPSPHGLPRMLLYLFST